MEDGSKKSNVRRPEKNGRRPSKKNGRRPQNKPKWKTTSIFF